MNFIRRKIQSELSQLEEKAACFNQRRVKEQESREKKKSIFITRYAMRDRYRQLAFVTLVQDNLEKGKMLIILAT